MGPRTGLFHLLRKSGGVGEIRASDVDFVYRLLLGRNPESLEIVEHWRRTGLPLETLAGNVLKSEEFAARWNARASGLEDTPVPSSEELALLHRHARAVAGDPDHVTNFLGVRTRIAFLPGLASAGGLVEGLPIPWNFHGDLLEWLGSLRAVDEARGRFVAVELGAGWGPWLVSTAVVARRRGIETVHLVGVEADPGKLAFLDAHMRDNGLDPARHTLLEAVVAARDGWARFPVQRDPSQDWGAAAIEGTATAVDPSRSGDHLVEVKAISLATLLDRFERVDLVHCDIQGDEVRTLDAGFDTLQSKVRRIVIGTHGRDLEEELFRLLAGGGWRLEGEKACRRAQEGRRIGLVQDGVQVWANPNLQRR